MEFRFFGKEVNFGAGFKRYFSNTTWMFAGRVIRTVGAFLVGIYVIRYLGPENLGMLTYAGMLVGLFMVFGTLGISDVLTRELVEHPEQKEILLGTSFCLKICGIVLVWIAVTLFLVVVETEPMIVLLIIVTAGRRMFAPFAVIADYFQSRVEARYVVMVTTFALLIVLATRLVLIQIEAGVTAFALATGLETACFAAGLVFLYRKFGNRIRDWRWDTCVAIGLLKDSWPFILSGLAVMVYMRIDQVMIKEMLGIHEVGIYAVAVTLSEAWYFVPGLIVTSLFPAIVNSRKDNVDVYHERLSLLYQMMFWIAVIVAVVTTFCADFIVPLLYGEAFSAASTTLSIHIWAGIFVALGVVNKSHLLAENLQKCLTISFSIGAVLNVFLNYFLISSVGIEGAAVSTIVAYAFASFFGLLLMRKSRPACVLMVKSLFRIPTFRLV